MLISAAVLVGWPVLMHYFNPQQPPEDLVQFQPEVEQQQPASPAPTKTDQAKPPTPTATDTVQTTNVGAREIIVDTHFWTIKFSNRGGVATSWILKKITVDGKEREIKAANGESLELIPNDSVDSSGAIEKLGAPLRLHLPWSPETASQLSHVNFAVSGLPENQNTISLNPGQTLDLKFSYSSPSVTASKTFTIHADKLTFEAAADVKVNGSEQPVYIVMGPRFGDQTEKQGGSYSVPPQVCAYHLDSKAKRVIGGSITPSFTKITGIDPSSNRIRIEKPLAGDVDSVKILGPDGAQLLGYARVLEREEGSRLLALDSIPQGAAVGNSIAQGTDTLREGYRWAGLVDRYFAVVVIPSRSVNEIVLTDAKLKVHQEEEPRDYPSLAVPLFAGEKAQIFVGAKDRKLIQEVGTEVGASLDPLIDYGFFSFMVRPLIVPIEWALESLALVFHNYGWAIVVVTVIINLALSPLRFYSSKKMKQAAKHQPRMKELQEKLKKLKESPKKNEKEMLELQREQMALMKEANPLGGCLPLLLQMPIFWAFFIYLTVSLDVRQQPWMLWIKDLSKADPYYLLPIIMCITMIASTWLTPTPQSDDPAMKMQRVMMTWFMPILLTWLFFLSAPSGLVLYWMIGNVVGVLIQLAINRLTKEPTAETPAPVKSGAEARKMNRRGARQES
jgi:YidC/Oxa1 family membrane protein insertase